MQTSHHHVGRPDHALSERKAGALHGQDGLVRRLVRFLHRDRRVTLRVKALAGRSDPVDALPCEHAVHLLQDRAEPLPDERLDAVRVFTLRVLDTAGDVGDRALRDFLAAGYTTQNALEIVLGIGTYTMSTLANRLTGAPVDDQLAAYA